MATAPGTILVIDDEEVMREVLDALLSREGYDVRLASDGHAGLELARTMAFDAAIVDVMMPGIDGLTVLSELKAIDEDLPVVMVTAFASVETALTAMKKGAFDYVTKPFKNDEVAAVVRNAVERTRLQRENRILKQNLQSHGNRFANIIGRSPKIRQVFDLIMQAAPSRTTVLVTGESGTGKELVARALHNNSTRADKAFVTVNSGNLPPDLLESNLFGHVKGAFTGAVSTKKGLFEVADKGTIFFAEIGNVPLETQAKLLRVIQEREIMRLAGVEAIKVDVRNIAATNADPKAHVPEEEFRQHPLYRHNLAHVNLPPLRERKEDIPLLVQHFLDKFTKESGRPSMILTPEAMDRLMAYHWPGNVRELENVIERAVVLCPDREIGVDLIPDHVSDEPGVEVPEVVIPDEGIHFREVITGHERRYIEAALEAAGGVQKRAAELLHIKATTLNEMIKRYEIVPRRRRGSGERSEPEPDAERTGT